MRQRVLGLVGAVTLLVSVVALPAQAAPPEQVDDAIFTVFLDFDNDKVGFWNITRDDLCEWVASGFVGPPPVVELVPVMFHETGQDAIAAKWKATRHFELWNPDDPANPQGPCEDTDEQAGPWATGDVASSSTDNDFFRFEDPLKSRTNSFGDVGQGTLLDTAGDSWHYSWNFRAHVDKNGEFSVPTEKYNLKRLGN